MPPQAGALLSLVLVFWTGSALFAVLHPRAVLRLAAGSRMHGRAGKEADEASLRIRVQGAWMSLAGLIVLALPLLL